MGHRANWTHYPNGGYAWQRLYNTQISFNTHFCQNIQYYFHEAAEDGNESGSA